MPHGFFTIEQWRNKKWVTVCHLNGDKPWFFRVVQTQRMVWAEKADGKLRLRKWHANNPETLSRSAKAFDRDRGRWPSS